MVLKNTTVLITNQCNSKCIMCNIWNKGISKQELSTKEFLELFSKPEFKELEDLNISGGEPLLRHNINELVKGMIKNKKKLRMFFLSTNGTFPEKTRDFFNWISEEIKEVYLCVSLEGDKKINKLVRGIDSYDSALKTIRLCKNSVNQINSIISMTLTPYNSNWECLSHIKKIAEETGSTYSFRIAWNNNTYYNNNEINLNLSPHQKDEVAKFIEKYCLDDPFMRIQLEYLKSGNVYIMGDKKSRIHCLAGDVFVLVKPDGSIYPCINSSRKIGDFERGIFLKTIKDIGKYEQCPCCTECCVYPMINWSEFREK